MENRVGFGPRAAGFIVDMICSYVFVQVGGFLALVTGMSRGTEIEAMFWASSGVALMVIYLLIEGFTGASPGKRLVGLKIGTQDRKVGGPKLYLFRFVIKYIFLIFTLVFLFIFPWLSIISGVLQFFIFAGFFLVTRPKKQALHDLIAKTAVYNKSDISNA